MAVSCDNPSELAELAKCFCIGNTQVQKAIELYLLATIAGGSMDPKTLAQQAAAAGFMGIPAAQAEAVETLLLCNIVNAL